jgi:hypothetical protein
MTLQEVMLQLRREYGSDRNAAAAHDMTPGQWNKLKNWNVSPTRSTLEKLGIEEIRTYQWKDK